MMAAPHVALIVDHPARDLGGLAWIAVELARRGVRATLVPMHFQESDLFALAPDLVVVNFLRRTNQTMIDKLIACGIRFVLLDTEGGFYGDMKQYGDTLSQNRGHYEALSAVLTWGRRMRDFWTGDVGLAAAKVRVTGQPRFDFYRPEFQESLRRFLPPAFRHGSTPLILLNTKVSVANPRFLTLEKEYDLYVNRLKLPREEVERHLRLGRESIAATCRIAEGLARTFPDALVVIRPHPHERLQTYIDRCGPSANLAAVQDGEVAPWILRMAVLLQRHCTTAIEAALAGRPVIAPQWWPTSAFLPDAEQVSYTAANVDELNSLVRAACDGALPLKEEGRRRIDEIIETWLFRVDGRSAERVAQEIVQWLPAERRVATRQAHEFARTEFATRSGLKSQAYYRFGQLTRYAGTARVLDFAERLRRRKWLRSGKGFSLDNVAAYVDVLSDRQEGMEIAPAQSAMDDQPLLTAVSVTAGAGVRAQAARSG